ncbi:hypothetical protein Taro_041216 [Colocasia esculenta]|uniref:Uncharacterized protein n=1 Tax=Colocasia esculenta TaxID=4460 RepID=A0A843X024_COLES|nr:hypothetical protein [Colocasia esculenta]
MSHLQETPTRPARNPLSQPRPSPPLPASLRIAPLSSGRAQACNINHRRRSRNCRSGRRLLRSRPPRHRPLHVHRQPPSPSLAALPLPRPLPDPLRGIGKKGLGGTERRDQPLKVDQTQTVCYSTGPLQYSRGALRRLLHRQYRDGALVEIYPSNELFITLGAKWLAERHVDLRSGTTPCVLLPPPEACIVPYCGFTNTSELPPEPVAWDISMEDVIYEADRALINEYEEEMRTDVQDQSLCVDSGLDWVDNSILTINSDLMDGTVHKNHNHIYPDQLYNNMSVAVLKEWHSGRFVLSALRTRATQIAPYYWTAMTYDDRGVPTDHNLNTFHNQTVFRPTMQKL